MAFVFDSTPKSPTANSYISVEDADAFAMGIIKGNEWLSLTLPQKQSLLVQSTGRLNIEDWGGSPTNSTNTTNVPYQALQWPRNWIIDRNYGTNDVNSNPIGNTYLDPDVIPLELKQATFTLAMHYLDEFLENPTVSRQDMDRLTSLSIGPLTMAIQARAEEAFPDMVQRQLRAIGVNGWLGSDPGTSFFTLFK